MSTPLTLQRDPSVTIDTLHTERGQRAALRVTPADARGTAVLVPGFTGSKEDFLTLLPLLGQAGWQALAFDHLGQFESPGTDNVEDCTIEALATDLLDVATECGEPVHVVGHSFGGLVVAEAAARHPEAFASVTVLSCGLVPLQGPLGTALEHLLAVPDGTPTSTVWQIRRQLEGPLDPGLPPDIAAFVEAKFVASPLAALKGKAIGLLRTRDLTPHLARTPGPFLVATGSDDDYWPLSQQRIVATALGTELVLFPGCGHSPAVDDPAAVAAEFDRFWTSSHS